MKQISKTKLGVERIIYQTKAFSKGNTINAVGLGLVSLLILALLFFADGTWDIQTIGVSTLFFLAPICLFIMIRLKKIILTESEFIVVYPFAFKPKVPLNDIEKMIFSDGRKEGQTIEIYKASSRWKSRYEFYHDYDDLKGLMDALRSKGIQVDCIGFKKPYFEWNTLEPKKDPFFNRME